MKKHSDINWPHLVSFGLKLVGKPYVFGAEVDLKDPNPDNIKAIDCSELVEVLYAQIGLSIPDGSYNQEKVCKLIEKGSPILIGDLAFKADPETGVVHHVGVYIGDEKILEAKGKQWGVVITSVHDFVASTHFKSWGRHKDILDA